MSLMLCHRMGNFGKFQDNYYFWFLYCGYSVQSLNILMIHIEYFVQLKFFTHFGLKTKLLFLKIFVYFILFFIFFLLFFGCVGS